MTMAGAKVEILSRPQSLFRFLAIWLASYLAPWGAAIPARLTDVSGSHGSVEHADVLAWFCVIPISLTFGQWMLMRRYLRNALPWAGATLTGALLAQFSGTIAGSILGWEIPSDLPTVLLWALCYGAAWSIPQALVLPGPRSTKIVWFIALMSTGFVSVMLRKDLSHALAQAFLFVLHEHIGYWIGSGYVAPMSRWLILSLVSGSIMLSTLRRIAAATTSQVLTRFE